MRPPHRVMFIIEVMVAATLLFTFIRLLLLARNHEMLATGIDNSIGWVARAFATGLRFDIALIFDILLPVVILLLIAEFWQRAARWLTYISVWWLTISLSLVLIAMIGNIPYFEHFQAHINIMGVHYATTDISQLIHMIISDSTYVVFGVLSLIVAFGATLLVILRARRHRVAIRSLHRHKAVAYLLLFCIIFPIADRGFEFRHKTLKARDAVISNNVFINKLGINAVHPFIESLRADDNTDRLMNSEAAAMLVRRELNRGEDFTEHVKAKESPWRNVIFIFAESISASRLTREGADVQLLPNFERLITEGRYYENCYSAGTHTAYGIYALVTSLQPFADRHPLEKNLDRPLNTIFEQMHDNEDMTTLFLVTHAPTYDNVQGFTTLQGFERLYSRDDYDYPTDKVWGVDDHILFDRTLQHIDSEWQANRDFVVACLTCSNHNPFEIPTVEGFTPQSSDLECRAVEYADWALNRFMEMASEREWFDETLFVIFGDHGRAITTDFAVPESLNHVPLLFYSPKHIAPEVCSDLVAQMDIAPTAISMLGREFNNHTMGIDLTRQSRSMIPYTADGYIAARDREWLYIYDLATEQPLLYDLTAEGDARLENRAAEFPERVYSMHSYAAATAQASSDMHNAVGAWSNWMIESVE